MAIKVMILFVLKGTDNEAASPELCLEDKVERAKILLAEKQNSTAREKAEVRTM